MGRYSHTWIAQNMQAAGQSRLAIVPRLAAGAPLLVIGLAHIFDPGAPMSPLVEAAGLPAVGVLSPLAVAVEIVAGVLLLAGFYVRLGAMLAIPTMVVAVYAHLVIDVWPNGAENEPPLALPFVVMVCAAYVLHQGAGRWSVDRLMRANGAG